LSGCFDGQDQKITMRKPKELVAYWLLPAEPARTFLIATIASLASRFGAVPFQPHVTIYAATDSLDEPSAQLRRTVAGCAPFRLKVHSIDRSDEFTKTVFLQFEPHRRLSQLSACLRRASSIPNNYQFNPHLSLIYKTMDRETKEKIARSLSVPFKEVLFDSAKAVISPAKIESGADVEAWRVVAEQKLTG
jgi:2'-5' RNA ligase superfamily